MRESEIERALCAHAKSKGWITYKFVSPGHKGVPDRIFVTSSGKVIFLEIKSPGKKPTALQMREIMKLRDQGAAACWCDSFQTGVLLLDIYSK